MILDLFTIHKNVVRPTAQVLLIYPFDEIWLRDKTKKKEIAMTEFAYIEFMTSPMRTNPYRDEKEEKKHIRLRDKYLNELEPDGLVIEACNIYESFFIKASLYYRLLQSSKKAIEGLRNFLDKVDKKLEDRTNSGGMVIKPADITRALKDISEVVKNHKSLENKLHDDVDDVKRRAGKEPGYFEDPDR